MAKSKNQFTIIIKKGSKKMIASAPLNGIHRLVFVINHQYTNAPNTTQISSGAGRSSAAGNNAAIKSPHTKQQQSVGADGTARNIGGSRSSRIHRLHSQSRRHAAKEVVVVLNDQIVKLPRNKRNASATQVASGGGTYSTGGTNSAINSPGTKQQHAVGGNGKAANKWIRKRNRRK